MKDLISSEAAEEIAAGRFVLLHVAQVRLKCCGKVDHNNPGSLPSGFVVRGAVPTA